MERLRSQRLRGITIGRTGRQFERVVVDPGRQEGSGTITFTLQDGAGATVDVVTQPMTVNK